MKWPILCNGLKIIDNLETNRIEYKQKLTDQLEKEAVAFLNYTGGGIIYLGIDNDGTVVGVDDSDQIQEKLEINHREYFRSNYLKPALELGLIEMTISDKPNSNKQKYRLSEKRSCIKSN
ncbi:MAG: ATP-binding protein [Crocinitomicaceae bacterium]|nr:ATP-binding protein [Crocinitomicaceae bacterium]